MMNILVCIDGSEHGYEAIKKAGEIASNTGSKKISVIYVRETSEHIPVFSESNGQLRQRFSERKEEVTEKIFLEAINILNQYNVECEKIIEDGDPVDRIKEVVSKNDFDLVVIGHRGLGRIQSMVLGSVSHGVVREVKADILVVKKKQ